MANKDIEVVERELSEVLDASYEAADKYLADIMGYATPDHPRWGTKHLTRDEIARLEHERYLWKSRKTSEWEFKLFKAELYERAEANYDALHPRRPDHWPKVVRECLRLDAEAVKALTRENLTDLIESLHPEAVKAERERERLRTERRREARRIRKLPENKKPWNWKEKRNWALTDEATNDNEPVNPARGEKTQPKSRGCIKRSRTGGFRQILQLLYPSKFQDDDREGDTPSILRMASSLGGSGQVSEEVPTGRPTGNDNEVLNSPEFASGYDFGRTPAPGEKISGRSRKLLGMK